MRLISARTHLKALQQDRTLLSTEKDSLADAEKFVEDVLDYWDVATSVSRDIFLGRRM